MHGIVIFNCLLIEKTAYLEDYIKKICFAYLENTISRDEFEILKKWISIEENQAVFKKFTSLYYRNKDFNTKKSFRKLEAEIFDDNRESPVQRTWLGFLKYAAILIGFSAFSYLVIRYNKAPVEVLSESEVTLEIEGMGIQTIASEAEKIVSNDKGISLARQTGNTLDYHVTADGASDIVLNTLNVPFGKTFQVLLPDSSLVYLNAGSRLRYPNKFKSNCPREVFLLGEGYFKVSKSAQTPFIVHTKEIGTKVYGTEFNISCYENDKKTKVVLVEGSVGVFENVGEKVSQKATLLLKPSEMATKVSGQKIEIGPVDIGGHIAWVDGTLLFRNEDFGSIIKKMERHYNIEITNNYDALNTKKFTGRFDVETIEQIFDAFQRTNNFHYTVNGRKVLIDP